MTRRRTRARRNGFLREPWHLAESHGFTVHGGFTSHRDPLITILFVSKKGERGLAVVRSVKDRYGGLDAVEGEFIPEGWDYPEVKKWARLNNGGKRARQIAGPKAAKKNAKFWHPPQPPRPPRPEPRWTREGDWDDPEDVEGANMTIYEDLRESSERDYDMPERNASYAQTATPYNPNDRDGWNQVFPRYSEEGYNLLVREPEDGNGDGPWTVFIDGEGPIDTGRGPWDDWEDAAIDAERWVDDKIAKKNGPRKRRRR